MKNEQVAELLYQALETERGGIEVYTAALECVLNDDLKKEWQEYLEQTRNHEQIVLAVMDKLGLDPQMETPGQLVVRQIGESLVEAMEMALEGGPPEAAQLVACESVVQAETKDHLNWELIHEIAEKSKVPSSPSTVDPYWTCGAFKPCAMSGLAKPRSSSRSSVGG